MYSLCICRRCVSFRSPNTPTLINLNHSPSHMPTSFGNVISVSIMLAPQSRPRLKRVFSTSRPTGRVGSMRLSLVSKLIIIIELWPVAHRNSPQLCPTPETQRLSKSVFTMPDSTPSCPISATLTKTPRPRHLYRQTRRRHCFCKFSEFFSSSPVAVEAARSFLLYF